MLLADQRIEIDARPAPALAPVLEVVLLGHCPAPASAADAGAQWQRVAGDADMLAALSGLGLHADATRLRDLLAGTAPRATDDAATLAHDAELKALYLLPLPVLSLGQFRVLFPYAFDSSTQYRSVLGGERAWLPQAVQDFFEGSSSPGRDQLKLWVIRVPEAGGAQAFLPQPGAVLTDPARLGAFERALLLRRAAILALPDLERLQVPAQLPDVPRLRLVNPLPVFLPVATVLDDSHRERRLPGEVPHMPEPLPPDELLAPIARTLARLRPDMMCLITLPLDAVEQGERPVPSQACLSWLEQLKRQPVEARGGGSDGDSGGSAAAAALRQLQFIYPYLRSAQRPLASPVGLVAGQQALMAQHAGPWRSIGEQPLPGLALPWPVLSQQEATALRRAPGITVLTRRAGRCMVDDERLVVPCLPPVALRRLTAAQRAGEHWYSAEIMRFMGWLRRELQQLGERLVFDTDITDPRPEMALRAFFNRLHDLGALRGARPEQAYRISRSSEGESTLIFEIEIAPAFPLDLIRITFVQDRHAEQVSTTLEALDG